MSAETTGVAQCPARNICAITTPGAETCGTIADHLPPLSVAEDLCDEALRTALYNTTTAPFQNFHRERIRRDLRLGWLHVDLGLCLEVKDAAAERYFSQAGVYAERILANPHRDFELDLEASRLLLHLPAFRTRRFNLHWGEEDEAEIANGLGNLLQATRTAAVHTATSHPGHLSQPDHRPCVRSEEERLGMLAKLATQRIAGRAKFKVFPAGFRELLKFDPDLSSAFYGHDNYVLGRQGKLPIKSRYDPLRKKIPPGIAEVGLYINYGGLTKEVALACDLGVLENEDLRQFSDHTFTIVAQEAKGREPSGQDRSVLDALTIGVKRRIVARAQTLRDFRF